MANAEWRLQGVEFVACSCDYGCPCQFNSRPSNDKCEAVVGMRIDQGNFNDVALDGLCWVGTFAWPGAIHEGNGRVQVFVDERATPAQREALLTILSGQESDPGANIFQVFSTTITEMYEPQFTRIDIDVDIDARTAHVSVPGVIESVGKPILNPVTGLPHRVRVTLPQGFEYTEAEFGSGTFSSRGAVAIASKGTHSHYAHLHLTGHGVVH